MPGSPGPGQGLIRTFDLLEHLRADIDIAYALLEDDRSSQFLRRCVVRAVFSYIESLVECVKVELRTTLRIHPEKFDLTEKEKETLGPLAIIGAPSGKFLPLDQNIKRTFKLAAKVWELKHFHLRTDGLDFQDFLAAKSARNRLTHPRIYYDIEITDHDMHCHTIAGMWVQAEFVRLFRALQDQILNKLGPTDQADILRGLDRMSAVLRAGV